MSTISLPSHDILVEPGALDSIGSIARRRSGAHRYVIITDDQVAPLYAARVAASFGGDRVDVLRIPAGEVHKSRESWARLTDELLELGCGRDSTIIALGGGVVGDLAGFVAATFMRGIPFIQAPTTLLAMIDASIGGKTGVDTPAGKNLVGAFHQPAAVVVDPMALATLSDAQLRAGVAEAIKHGVIADALYFERVSESLPTLLGAAGGDAMRELIVRSIEIKADIVRRDEREGGLRKVLNFGHTIGHAIEAESGYRLLHGEAVAIGMVLESALAERVGIAETGTTARVRAAVERAGLSALKPPQMSAERLLASTRLDKKARRGAAEYALPARIGTMAGAGSGWGVRVADEDVLRALA